MSSEVETQCIYWIKAPSGYMKIGVANDPWDRLATLQTGHHEKLELIYAIAMLPPNAKQRVTDDGRVNGCELAPMEDDDVRAVDYEREMHRRLAPLRVHGEWFKFDARLFQIAERLAWAKVRYPQIADRWWGI